MGLLWHFIDLVLNFVHAALTRLPRRKRGKDDAPRIRIVAGRGHMLGLWLAGIDGPLRSAMEQIAAGADDGIRQSVDGDEASRPWRDHGLRVYQCGPSVLVVGPSPTGPERAVVAPWPRRRDSVRRAAAVLLGDRRRRVRMAIRDRWLLWTRVSSPHVRASLKAWLRTVAAAPDLQRLDGPGEAAMIEFGDGLCAVAVPIADDDHSVRVRVGFDTPTMPFWRLAAALEEQAERRRGPVRGVVWRTLIGTYALNGAIFASWAPHVAGFKAAHGLSDSALGRSLMGMPAGLIAGVFIAKRLIDRCGSARPLRWAMVWYCLAIAFPAFAWNGWSLLAALVFVGLGNGATDLASGKQTTTLEHRAGSAASLLFQAALPLGEALAAGIATVLIGLGVGIRPHLIVIAAIGLLATGVFVRPRRLLADDQEDMTAGTPSTWRHLLLLGGLAFAALLAAGAVADWSSVFVKGLGAAPILVGAGLALSKVGECGGRVAAFFLSRRLSPPILVGGGAVVAAGGCLLVLSAHTLMAVLGFGLMGLGLTSVYPTALSAAGRLRLAGRSAAQATRPLAVITWFGYGGFTAGPPLLGFVAQGSSLRVMFAIPLVLCVAVACMAGVVRTPAVER